MWKGTPGSRALPYGSFTSIISRRAFIRAHTLRRAHFGKAAGRDLPPHRLSPRCGTSFCQRGQADAFFSPGERCGEAEVVAGEERALRPTPLAFENSRETDGGRRGSRAT